MRKIIITLFNLLHRLPSFSTTEQAINVKITLYNRLYRIGLITIASHELQNAFNSWLWHFFNTSPFLTKDLMYSVEIFILLWPHMPYRPKHWIILLLIEAVQCKAICVYQDIHWYMQYLLLHFVSKSQV